MNLPQGSAKLAREFARAIVRRKWNDLAPLLSESARTRLTPDDLAAEFGWSALGPRLRRQWIADTGEAEDVVPELDPPKRFELFEVHGRERPADVDPQTFVGWMEVDFLPSEDSEFDVCYNCFLALVDEGGPRVAAYAIENARD